MRWTRRRGLKASGADCRPGGRPCGSGVTSSRAPSTAGRRRRIRGGVGRGRVYLPLEDLRAHGCAVEDLAAGVVTEPVRRLIEFECRRARDFYRRAKDALPPEDRRRLVAAEIMRAVYSETLTRIER